MIFHFAKDKWDSTCRVSDKFYHAFGSALIFAALWIMHCSELACFLLTFLAGLALEIKDGVFKDHLFFEADGFSWRDLVADTLGALAMWGWIAFWR